MAKLILRLGRHGQENAKTLFEKIKKLEWIYSKVDFLSMRMTMNTQTEPYARCPARSSASPAWLD